MSAPALPEVVLIGDSIRMGYQATAAAALAGRARVWGPEANGGHSVNVLMHLHLWVQHRRPAVVHVNAGLHDIRTLWYGGRPLLVPIEHYRANVRAIVDFIRTIGGARVVWALTTPVDEAKAHAIHAQWNDFDRYQADVEACNAAARAVCAEAGVPVHDLHAVGRAAQDAGEQDPDGVHFTEAGYRRLGAAVAASVTALL